MFLTKNMFLYFYLMFLTKNMFLYFYLMFLTKNIKNYTGRQFFIVFSPTCFKFLYCLIGAGKNNFIGVFCSSDDNEENECFSFLYCFGLICLLFCFSFQTFCSAEE
jgi:hypothetical protein